MNIDDNIWMIQNRNNSGSAYYSDKVLPSWDKFGYYINMFDCVYPDTLHEYDYLKFNKYEISNKYNLQVIDLVEINNLNNPNSIKVGQKLLFSKNDPASSDNYQITNKEKTNELLELDKKTYGPITIQSKSYKDINGREVLNVLNQENKKLILSINCDTNELDVRIPGKKWMGSKPAQEEFENTLINDFC